MRRRNVKALLVLVLSACAGGENDTGNDPSLGTSTTMSPTTSSTTSAPTTTTSSADAESTTTSVDSSTSGGESSTSGMAPDVPIECDDDPNEPNDEVDLATPLGEIDDDDSTIDFAGVLDGPIDVDWLSYHGVDTLGETVDPARSITVTAGTLELCKFLVCDAGTAIVTCPPGTSAATQGFMDGCCGSGSFAFDSAGFECQAGAFDTSATVLLRLRNADQQCVAYSGSVHF